MNTVSKNDIGALRTDFNELKEELSDEIEVQKKNSKIRRVENTHVLVALAIFGAFTSGISNQFLGQKFVSAFQNVGWFSVIFLLLKTTTLSVRPIVESRSEGRSWRVIKKIDDLVLPIVYIILLYSGFSILFIGNLPEIGRFIPGAVSIEVLFWLEVLVLAGFGYLYSKELESSMSLESSSRDDVLIFPSSTSESKLEFYVKNTRDDAIPAGDIDVIIVPPKGVTIEDVYPAMKSGDKWTTTHPLPADQRMKITLEISIDDSIEEGTENTIDVLVEFEDNIQSTESLSFRS